MRPTRRDELALCRRIRRDVVMRRVMYLRRRRARARAFAMRVNVMTVRLTASMGPLYAAMARAARAVKKFNSAISEITKTNAITGAWKVR